MTAAGAPYRFRLYVAGGSPHSVRAIARLRQLADRHLAGRYELEVIDLREQPGRASEDDIMAVPTLIMTHPGPSRRIIGDLRDEAQVLSALDISPGL